MMTVRRYLVSIYDWTGLSALMYKSKIAHLSVMFILSLLVVGAFVLFAKIPVLSDPMNVQLNSFAPPDIIAFADHILLIVLGFFLISNIVNMYYKIIGNNKSIKVPFPLVIKEGWHLILHFATQIRFAKCDKKRFYWLTHWLLMSSYTLMFIIIIFFLDWFQTDEIHEVSHPQRWIGYYTTIGIIFATSYYAIGRIRRKEEIFKFSHHSDWYFIVLLFLIAVTGILIHIFRINGMAMATYISYVAHLAIEVPMVVTFVAFSKWSHIAYRPFAIYFRNIKESALKLQKA